MKAVYTILFFIATLLLIVLSFYLFRMIDKGVSTFSVALIVCGISINIVLLVFLLQRYLRTPSSGRHH